VGLAPTGNRIDIGGMLIARLVDGQIDSAWSVFDSGQLMQQARGELLI
jgi:predicted ester cyclase